MLDQGRTVIRTDEDGRVVADPETLALIAGRLAELLPKMRSHKRDIWAERCVTALYKAGFTLVHRASLSDPEEEGSTE